MMKYLDRMFGILQWLSDETEKYYPLEVVDQQAKQIRKLERDVEIAIKKSADRFCWTGSDCNS